MSYILKEKRNMVNHNMRVHWLLALPAMLLVVGCGKSALSEEGTGEEEKVELQVSPQVALTRSTMQGTDAATDGAAMGSIAVYASNATTNDATNNHGLYTYSGGSWSNSGTDKIYLSAEEANICAYYPAYKPGTGGVLATTGTILKMNGNGQVAVNSTVNISVFPGTESAAIDVSTDNNGSSTALLTVSGEMDYMHANQTSTPKANYKKSVSTKDGKVTLSMKHALAMVSSRVCTDHTYKNTGALIKLVLKNVSPATILNNGGTDPTMKISNDTIIPGSSSATATYTRGISNYTLQKVSADIDNARTTAQNASKKVGILVLPESAQDKVNVEVTLRIGGQDYAVSLGNAATNVWKAGENYLYTAKLGGKELSITSITVAQWDEKTGGSLEIQQVIVMKYIHHRGRNDQ